MTRAQTGAKPRPRPDRPRSAPSDPERAARCLQALGHPVRLRILETLRAGAKAVNELNAAVGGTQANVSQHLRVLRDREILGAEKIGNRVYYYINDPRVLAILDAVQTVFCRHD